MKVVEYGQKNKDVILLLHGGGLSWWNYREVAELLQDEYHVVLPILDGHAGSDKDFTSIENNAKEVIEYIDDKYQGSVLLIGGLSLGAQVAVEILSRRQDICQFAVIESALIIPMKITHYLIGPMIKMSFGLIKQEWFAKLQFKSLKIKEEFYEEYYKDTCEITEANMTSFLKANSYYIVKEELKDTKAETYLFVGQREPKIMLQSGYRLKEIIANSMLEVLKKKYHGEFSINNAKEYAKKLKDILE